MIWQINEIKDYLNYFASLNDNWVGSSNLELFKEYIYLGIDISICESCKLIIILKCN
jgi:hypothetical protein